jgi:hypothetical protein
LVSSTPVPAEPPVIQRLNRVIAYVTKMVPANSKGASIAKRVASEMLLDVSEIPPEFVEFYVKQLSVLMYWTATGETVGDMPLPEDFETEA